MARTPRNTRSKTPPPRRGRSAKKTPPPAPASPASPEKEEAAKATGGLDLNDKNVQLLLTVAFLVGLSFYKNGELDLNPRTAIGTLINVLVEDIPLPRIAGGLGLFMTGHILNCARSANDSFWMNSVFSVYVAANAPILVTALLRGEGLTAAFASEEVVTICFAAWYLCKRDVPFINKNLWDEANKAAGPIIENFLTLSTMLTVTRFIVAASQTPSVAGCLGFSIFTPLFYAVFAGAASDFFPASKGFTITDSENVQRAIAIASYPILLSLVFSIPTVGGLVESIYTPASTFIGGNDVMFFLMVQHLAGHLVPVDPLKIMSETVQKVLKL